MQKSRKNWEGCKRSAKTSESEKEHLLVEVKGCSGDSVCVELTSNEYKAMLDQPSKYQLAIVTNALEKPHPFIIRYNKSDETWRDQDGREAKRIERTGARIVIN